MSKKTSEKSLKSNSKTYSKHTTHFYPNDREDRQAFYAGGSSSSGQQILGPSNSRDFREHLNQMFEITQESGAVVIDAQNAQQNDNLYEGTGVRLGESETDHAVVTDENSSKTQNNKSLAVLKLWAQGFTVNNGELREYEDPQNIEFLKTIMIGEVPNELLHQMGSNVTVDVEYHTHENYKKPESGEGTFEGPGHTLGNLTEEVEENTPSIQASTSGMDNANNSSNNEENENKANKQLKLQSDQPMTVLQIRLADGTRVLGRFNLTHTIYDIRQYIIILRPEYEFTRFAILTSFPARELSDETQTIQDAGLLNASIMQRLN